MVSLTTIVTTTGSTVTRCSSIAASTCRSGIEPRQADDLRTGDQPDHRRGHEPEQPRHRKTDQERVVGAHLRQHVRAAAGRRQQTWRTSAPPASDAPSCPTCNRSTSPRCRCRSRGGFERAGRGRRDPRIGRRRGSRRSPRDVRRRRVRARSVALRRGGSTRISSWARRSRGRNRARSAPTMRTRSRRSHRRARSPASAIRYSGAVFGADRDPVCADAPPRQAASLSAQLADGVDCAGCA